jgi:hypothetical protein
MQRNDRMFIKELRENDKNKDTRLSGLETSEYSKIRMYHAAASIGTGAIAAGATYTSPDMRPETNPNARGIFASIQITPQVIYTVIIYLGSSDDTPDGTSQRFVYVANGGVITGNVVLTQLAILPLGKDGKFKLVADAGSGGNGAFIIYPFGWWE